MSPPCILGRSGKLDNQAPSELSAASKPLRKLRPTSRCKCSGYRAPRTSIWDAARSISRRSSDVSSTIDGVGLTFLIEEHARPDLTSGQLVRVLEDWCEPFAGYFMYYPSRRQQPAALAALIDCPRL